MNCQISNIAVFEKEGTLRQTFLTPVILPDEQYRKEWLDTAYEKKPFQEDTPEHYTQIGERVRSKSEVLIADPGI
ncbi:MAG: hypothetical protein J6I56_07970 [Lachnospiraceae bacterium]|nr:hypothetical protein [Lachnospiraceae bacterium]